MTPTSVGMRCPECAGDRTEVRTAQTLTTGRMQATYVLIGINVAVFVLQLLDRRAVGHRRPASSPTARSAATRSATAASAAAAGRSSSRPAASGGGSSPPGFLHGGLIHLALNMFVLFILGQVLEPAIGTVRFVAVYLVSLIAGSVGALIMSDPFTFTVGASGAIYGLFIATIVIARQRGQMQVVQQLAFWLVINLVFTFAASNISVGGHLGGIVGGAIGALIVVAAERSIARRETLPAELAIDGRARRSSSSRPRSSSPSRASRVTL